MIIKKKLGEGVWCKYKGKIEFLIRVFKISEFDFEEKSSAKTIMNNFIYCLVDWKGITEEDGKTGFKCTKENKEYLYNYYTETREFIFGEIKKQQEELEKSIKN